MSRSTESTLTTVFLPVEWQTGAIGEPAVVALAAFIEVMLVSPALIRLSFVVQAGGDTPARAGWIVRGFDAATTSESAELVGSVALALNA